jgi:uncharacterized protein YndB with AHSA1/START domain
MPRKNATRSITLEVELDASRDAVWRALTSPEELARWFPPVSGGGSALGDRLLLSWGEDMQWSTTIAAVEPEKHVRWIDDPVAHEKTQSGESDKPTLVVDWYLETRGGKTIVRLVNSGFGESSEWDDSFNATDAGWRYFLFNLKQYLERHSGTPRVMVSERRKSPVTREILWTRLVGDVGLALAPSGAEQIPSVAAITLDGERLPVVVELANPPGHLWLRFPSLNDALMLVEAEPGRDSFHCGLWLSTYGLPESRVSFLREGLRGLSDRVFAVNGN